MHTRPVDTVQRHKSMALQLPPISECGKTQGEDQALKNVKPEQDRKQTSKVTYPRSVIKAYLSWKQKNWRIKLNQKQNIPILLSRVDIVRRGYSFHFTGLNMNGPRDCHTQKIAMLWETGGKIGDATFQRLVIHRVTVERAVAKVFKQMGDAYCTWAGGWSKPDINAQDLFEAKGQWALQYCISSSDGSG